LAGVGVGFGLCSMMIPYLSQALGDSLAGVTGQRVVVAWLAVGQSYVLLVAVYGLALLLLVLVFRRGRLHPVVWVEEE